MKLSSRFALSAALASCMAAAQIADARPAVPISHPAPGQRLKWDSKKFMHVGELRPGMRGYALTVFKGTKISKFGIEILGIVSKFNEGKDYIMFRATDGPPVTRALGIAHGMSGSPIYIGGRLVGAISLGNDFARDPIGFATPIEAMFDAWSPDLPAKPSSLSATPSQMAEGMQSSGKQSSYGVLDMPLTVSGMNARGIARLQNALGPFHFNVMAGGGAGTSTDSNPLAVGATLVPGSAVGVSLVQGDIDMTATGTVTYRDGNRLLLFGHPFTSLGPIDAALTTAYVVDIYPSYQSSVKFGAPIKTVGRIFQDRPFSVGGEIGPMPQMIPLTISVDDQSIKRRKNYSVRVINHPMLTGQLISQVADTAIQQVHGQPGDSMAQVTLDVDVEEIGHVKRTNTFYDALGIDQTAISDLDSLMRLLSANPFYPLAVKSVKMAVTIQNRHDTAEIDHLFVKQSKFAPGDTVEVGVVLKPYKQPLYTRMISVKIPQSTPDGTLSLGIQGGGSGGGGGASILSLLLGGRSSEPTEIAANVSQLARQWVEKPHNNDLVARLTLPTSAISIRGEKLSGLPPTLAAVMQSNRSTGLRTERDEVKLTEAVPYIVTGSQSLSIIVRKKDLSEAPRPPSAAPSGSAAGTPGDPAAAPAESAAPTPLSSGGDDDEESARLLALPVGFAEKEPTPAQAPSLPKREGSESKMTEVKAGAAPSLPPALIPPVSGGGPRSGEVGSDSVKPVGRLPSIWRQATMSEFAAGTLQNVAVTSLGDVRLSPSLTKVADTPTSYIWAIQPDGNGAVYLATGDGGSIYKLDVAGKVSLFYKTGELEVTALAVDSDGTLFAGTAPNGRIFKIAASGVGSKIFTAQEKYITALVFDKSHNRMIAATGGGTGRVYALDELALGSAQGTAAHPKVGTAGVSIVFTSPEPHILSLATDKAGAIYAGCAPDGIVYKIAPDGKSSVFYDAVEPSISALATDSSGNVYAGTAPTGTVYRVAADGTAKRLLGRAAPGISCLKADGSDSIYASSGSTVYKINPDDTVQSFVAQADEQFLSLALDPFGFAVYAGTGTVGSVYKIGLGVTMVSGTGDRGILAGVFQSTVHDTGGKSRWGTLAWTADTPTGSAVALQTRTGDVERPDGSWSPWSASYTHSTGQTVTSPPARFIQYQALLSGPALGVAPKLRNVSLFYLPRNRAPVVQVVKPAGGDALSKAAQLQWMAADPEKDTLTYDVSYSADGGKTWTPIKKRAQPSGSKAPKDTAAQSQANLDKMTNVPPAIKAQIAAQVAATAKASAVTADSVTAGTDTANKTAQNLKETSFTWDTTEVPDGTYQIQVIASDKPSNPVGALTGKSVSNPFVVANALPTLTLNTPALGTDKSVTVQGTATTGLAFVRAVQGRADSGDFVAASADDGLFDSGTEAWTLVLPPLSSGSHKIEVVALDRAGNSVTQSVTVRVP